MSDLAGKLEMLKQMRWQAAQEATGGLSDRATDKLIRLHAATVALEATAAEGPPEQTSDTDVDGYALTDRSNAQEVANVQAADAAQDDEEDDPYADLDDDEDRSPVTGY